jgi:hypothetical protein
VLPALLSPTLEKKSISSSRSKTCTEETNEPSEFLPETLKLTSVEGKNWPQVVDVVRREAQLTRHRMNAVFIKADPRKEMGSEEKFF